MNKLLFIFILAALPLYAQVERRGTEVKGIQQDILAPFRPLGLVAAWDARYGMQFSSTTNIASWTDLTGNYTLRQPITTNQPSVSLIQSGPTSFKNVAFRTTAAKHMVDHRIADQLVRTNFTWIVLIHPEVNAGTDPVMMSWTQSTNALTSKTGIIGANSPSGLNSIASAGDGTGVVQTQATPSIGLTTNRYFGMIYSNGTLRAVNNVTFGATVSVPISSNLNTFAVGAQIHTNFSGTRFWSGSLSGIYLFKGAMPSNTYVNVINALNSDRTVY